MTCVDINECTAPGHGCHANAVCANTVGSHTCTCSAGYTGDGRTCADINECTVPGHGCHANAVCANTVGSHTCTCSAGYTGDGRTCAATCAPVANANDSALKGYRVTNAIPGRTDSGVSVAANCATGYRKVARTSGGAASV